MKLISLTFLVTHVVNKNLFVDGQTDCGRISLTYVQTGSTVEAKLRFSPITELSRYKWVHFFSRTKPNFDFLKHVEEDRSKYDLKDFELIIRNLQASDDGIYNTECYLENGYQTFSENTIEIKKPYTVQPSRRPSVTSKVEIGSTLKQTSKTTAYVNSVMTQAVRKQNQETLKKTPATHEHDIYTIEKVPYSRYDQIAQTSKETETTTNEVPNKTSATLDYDMLTTSLVPFSGSEQVTLTSKETEEITTNGTHKETVITHKNDMYATNEVPYSKSDQDQVTEASNILTEVTTNETAEKTLATLEHDMYTNEVPFSGSEQVTLTSKVNEEITTNETPKETVITHKDDMYATNEVPYSKSDQDQVTVASNVTEVTTNETAEKTSATLEHDMYTNEVPFSGSEQVTLTSKVNEEITTNETPKETVITRKDDMYATNEVPYSKSDQVTVVSKVTDNTITTMIGGICGVLLITVLTTVTIIKLRKKRCTTNETEEGDKQQSGSYLYDAQCCEINQLEDERVAIGIKLQTFSSSEPGAVPVNNTTCRKNSCLNTRAVEDESGNEYTVIEYDSKASRGHESATEYCRKKTVDYENYEISTMTVESGNEYETIKY